MQAGIMRVAAIAALLSLPRLAAAADLATLSDLGLIQKTRDAVAAQNAEGALDLLTEMERRGTGLFIGAKKAACEEQIELPVAITDWRFKGAARQAYIAAAKLKRLEEESCGCVFERFTFEEFTVATLGKMPVELVDADRAGFDAFLAENQSDAETRYRDLEQSCRVN